MYTDETCKEFITSHLHTAASLYGMGCDWLGSRQATSGEIAELRADGESAREGSYVFIMDASNEGFAGLLQLVRNHTACGNYSDYSEGIQICKRSLPQRER